ncbi:MAG: 3-isopropylmalate dehydratase large subunit [Pseudomonadota bacterium]
MTQATTLFDKLWQMHRIADAGDGADLLALDRVFLHERTGGVALKSLAECGRSVRSPERVWAIMDHIVSFKDGRGRDESRSPGGEQFILETRERALAAGIGLIDTDDPHQGIVHVVTPELGLALPGMTVVCPDSHTCSLGALGALAWGIGSSQAEHAMATSALRQQKPGQMRVSVNGAFSPGVTAKDLALHLIAAHGAAGGQRCAIEFAGETVANMDIEERLTLCNLAVEFSAFTGLIAPDDVTFRYVHGRRYAPKADQWERALQHWQRLKTDRRAVFDHEIEVQAEDVSPTVTWGTSPEEACPLDQHVPVDANPRALAYMGLRPGQRLSDLPIEGVFIGSCTNGRLSDLRAAADVLRDRKVADGMRAVCVPGSRLVRAQAEAEGLDVVFKQAGFQWGAPGCAMCFYAGGETFERGARVVSSTNRNFEGRQGPGVRTHLASPATAAASAVAGRITSARSIVGGAGR